jgi:S-formylglutathione hydrolase
MRMLLAAAALAAAWLLAPSGAAFAQGRIEEVQVAAPSLANNLIGTPAEQTAAIYLPRSYRRASGRRYPVIYLLHGVFDSHDTWLGYVDIKARLDRLIASERIREVIVVMPDGGNTYGGGFYRNSPVTGNWRDFVTDDLVSFVDARYRTLARPGGRAVAGWSMGGYGAIHIAMERPGLFSVAYAISPCCLAPVDDLGFGNDAWQRAYAYDEPSDIQAAFENNDFYPVAAIGVLSAFAEAPAEGPFHVRFPVVLENGQFVPGGEAYDGYIARFPLSQLAQRRSALLGLRAFGMEFGIDDQFTHIPVATRMFSERLSELRVPHRLDVYDGDHRQEVAARMESIILPFITAALDPPE